jgi:hypothetical protein
MYKQSADETMPFSSSSWGASQAMLGKGHKQAINLTLLSEKISRLRLRLPNHRQINSETQDAINEEAVVSHECQPWNRKEITMSN